MNAWLLIVGLLGIVAPATDLQQTAAAAAARKLPIMLYVSRSDCTFCRRFEVEVLGPIVRSGEFTDTIIIRELTWDAAEPVTDFDGRRVIPEALAARYDAKLTPTLLFLDLDGRELAPRITGYQQTEFFSYYLEAAMRKAWTIINQGQRRGSHSEP